MHYPISTNLLFQKTFIMTHFLIHNTEPLKFIPMQKKKKKNYHILFFSRINLIIMYQINIKIQILNKKLYIGQQNITFVSNL